MFDVPQNKGAIRYVIQIAALVLAVDYYCVFHAKKGGLIQWVLAADPLPVAHSRRQ